MKFDWKSFYGKSKKFFSGISTGLKGFGTKTGSKLIAGLKSFGKKIKPKLATVKAAVIKRSKQFFEWIKRLFKKKAAPAGAPPKKSHLLSQTLWTLFVIGCAIWAWYSIITFLAGCVIGRVIWDLVAYLGDHSLFIGKLPPQGKYKILSVGAVMTKVFISDPLKNHDFDSDTLEISNKGRSLMSRFLQLIGGYVWLGISKNKFHKGCFETRTIKEGARTGKKDVESIKFHPEVDIVDIIDFPIRFFAPFIADKIEDADKLHIFYFLNPYFEVTKPVLFTTYLQNNDGKMRNILGAYSLLLITFSDKYAYSVIMKQDLRDVAKEFQKMFFDFNDELERQFGIRLLTLTIEDLGLDDEGKQVELSQKKIHATVEAEANFIVEKGKTTIAEQAIKTAEKEAEAQRKRNAPKIELARDLETYQEYMKNVERFNAMPKGITTLVINDGEVKPTLPV